MENILGYKDSVRFLNQFNNITYPEFDYYSVHSLNLFSSFDDINLEEIELNINRIESILPSIKRIFAKPIIHLIDEDEVIPIESVKKIDYKSISYASTHSELWDNITKDGIKPLKLLTTNHKDNYAIYENIVFSRCVDSILMFTRHNSRILKDMIYTNRKLEIDLLERENHMSYYLALGKLETGHIRSFSKYIDLALNLISRMDFIYNFLSARLKRPIYVKCHKIKGKIKLRKTNILRMQKDYNNIYKYMKNIYSKDIDDIEDKEYELGYKYFCKYLTIFSIGHFNFEIDNKIKMDFNNLNLDFKFKKYNLNVKDVKVNDYDSILLTFKNDVEYKIYLIPSLKKNIQINIDDEYHILDDDYDSNNTYVSINNLDSFRRVQQLILKGMIYSTTNFDTCPFCGNELEFKQGKYYCSKCREVIYKQICNQTNKEYYVSTIDKFKLKETNLNNDEFIKNRFNESILHFRNINKLTEDLSNICPYCNKVHYKGLK